MILAAVAGTDYPILAHIPEAGTVCDTAKPGFYANVEKGQCQAFDRCDVNGNLTSYLCPNQTLFNQITLICDYWYNVDCSKAASFKDYSNSRLYTDKPLLDNQDDVAPAEEKAKPAPAKPTPAPAKATPAPAKPAATPNKGDTVAAKTGAVKVSGKASSSGSSKTN